MSIFDKAKDALKSDKAEELSDKGLDKLEQLVGDKLGAEHADKIAQAREAIDERIGTNDAADTAVTDTEK